MTSALEQIFYYFQTKKEETKNSTSSNLSNYSSMEGNFVNKYTSQNSGSLEVLDGNKFQIDNPAKFIDTATKYGNFSNFDTYTADHDGDFFFMDNLR